LRFWAKRLASGDASDRDEMREVLRGWRRDTDLAGLRAAALAELPEDEQLAWGSFWAEVAALLKKAG
jgi:hypothetical protein